MKKTLLIILGFSLAPLLVFAVNNVTLTDSAVIKVGSNSFAVLSSSATLDSITVTDSTFSVTLSPGASVVINAPVDLSIPDAGTVTSVTQCNTTNGALHYYISNPSSGSTNTVTATPGSSSSCSQTTTTTTTTTTTGGGGPVGGNYGPPSFVSSAPATPAAPTVWPAVPAAPSPNAQPSPRALQVSPVFNRGLVVGNRNNDVMRLQKVLNADPDTQIASLGAGSPGNETNYFGPATLKALQRFQVKYGIAGPGIVGYGNLGPKTRAKIAELFSGTVPVAPSATPSAPVASTNTQKVQALLLQLQALQAQLNKLKGR